MNKKTAFYILGLPETATKNEVKSAYRKLIKSVHPDVSQIDSHFYKIVKESYDYINQNCYSETISIVEKRRSDIKKDFQNENTENKSAFQQEIKAEYVDNKIVLNNNYSDFVYTPKTTTKDNNINTSDTILNESKLENISTDENQFYINTEADIFDFQKEIIISSTSNVEKTTFEILLDENTQKNKEIVTDNIDMDPQSKFKPVTLNLKEKKLNQEKTIPTIKNKNKISFNLKELEYLSKNGFIEKKHFINGKEEHTAFLSTEVFGNLSSKFYIKDKIVLSYKLPKSKENKSIEIPFEKELSPYGVFINLENKMPIGKFKVLAQLYKYKQFHTIKKNDTPTSATIIEFKIDTPEIKQIFDTFTSINVRLILN